MEINLGDTKPIFAHDVGIVNTFRAEKTKKGKIKKEAFTELVFIDGVKKQAVSRVVLPLSVMKILPNLFMDNLRKIKKEMMNQEAPEKQKIEINSTNASYLG